MPAAESALLTAADYRRLTPEWPLGPRYELIEGELLPMSAPNRFHQEISRNLCWIIDSFLRRNPIGVIYTAPFDVYLNDHNVFQPDLLYVSRVRAAVLVPEGVVGAPDLVIEILSRSTAKLDRTRKLQRYARTGTGEMWLVDPQNRTVEIFDLGQDGEKSVVYRQDEGEADFEFQRLPGLRIALADIFAARLG